MGFLFLQNRSLKKCNQDEFQCEPQNRKLLSITEPESEISYAYKKKTRNYHNS